MTVADPTNGVCGCAKESIDFTDTWKAKVAIVSGAIVSVAIASADAWKVKVIAALLHVHRMCTACTLHIMSMTT